MSLARALILSICATVANWAAVTIGVFVSTALKVGLTADLVAQLQRILANMLSPGWLAVTLIAATLSFVGCLVVRGAASASTSGKVMRIVIATGIIALVPAFLAIIVFDPAVVGLAIVLLVSGAAVTIASKSNAPVRGPKRTHHVSGMTLEQRAVFGRRRL